MKINSATFRCSSSKSSQCPADGIPEFAFIGRSNVGKSSLINMLTNHKGLAKVSGTPGKTRLINHFLINEEWYLVDLPGYGYARVSKSERSTFSRIILDYIDSRPMVCLFVLIDSRLEPQKIDVEFINLMGEKGVPFALIFTKTDKLKSQNQTESNIARYKRFLHKTWDELPPILVSSSEKKTGRDEILTFIENCMDSHQNGDNNRTTIEENY